ncbi:hypothetical protein SAMN06295912_12528 [Sphingomonas laterariae]|uniref:Uncharacterized protein n=2 Tax=Edaphosphingomonas laterariae TaxID=861865 RepID=A0A239ILK8_9SPHN|nr:hypothetical protein SAMN06295912_12528 [Sphingomonas laterariae]
MKEFWSRSSEEREQARALASGERRSFGRGLLVALPLAALLWLLLAWAVA